jgi:hypothetical protein
MENQFIEKLQVIKGVIRNGKIETTVHDIESNLSSSIDLSTCQVSGVGLKSLCSVWDDPDFIPEEESFYYVRVVANQSCRWSHKLCLENPEYCQDENDNIPKFIQERAWTSPIWLENL